MTKSWINALFAIGLLAAFPVMAQNPQAQQPSSQTLPAQEPAPQNPPVLEKPTEATPETEEKKPEAKAPEAQSPDTKSPDSTTPQAKTPGTKAPAAPTAKVVKKPSTGEGRTVEEIIARVNNEIITKSELDKARTTAEEDARQECANRCSSEQLQGAIEERQKYALRDLIDQSLLAQRGKDMGVNVETDVVKQLDQIRISNKLKDMDELEKPSPRRA